jgi:hypothetical protein
VSATLATALRTSWMVPAGAGYPAGPSESGERFAAAVAGWFAAATAGPFPCTTAAARRPQLASLATAALQAGDPAVAGAQLALAVAGYLTGQVFGAGVASPPTAIGVAQPALGAVFSDHALSDVDRSDRVATAIGTLALSTVVVFPPVVSPPVPVT